MALAWHHEREAGVDIEQHGDRVTRVRRRFVNDEEEASLDRNRELEALLLHWSAKETVYKILDIQGLDLREHLSLHPFVVKEAGHFTMEERYTPAKSCFDITYLVNPDFSPRRDRFMHRRTCLGVSPFPKRNINLVRVDSSVPSWPLTTPASNSCRPVS